MSLFDENEPPQYNPIFVSMASIAIGIGIIFCLCSFPLLLSPGAGTPNSICGEACFGSILLVSGGYSLYRLRTSRAISASVWGTFSGLLLGILLMILVRINQL